MTPTNEYSPGKVWQDFLQARDSAPMFLKYRAEHPELGEPIGSEQDYGNYRVQFCLKGLIICNINDWQSVTHIMLEDGQAALPLA